MGKVRFELDPEDAKKSKESEELRGTSLKCTFLFVLVYKVELKKE